MTENPAPCIERLPTYGGQALIEGVMMRGSRAVAAAMRAPDGSIVVHSELLGGVYQRGWLKIPFLRGLVGLWDSLGLGMRYLSMSANLQAGEDEKIEGKDLALTLVFSLALAIGLFFATPALLGWVTQRFLGLTHFWSNIAEGLIRLLFVIGYIWLVGKVPDIARVFAYHGAEHKTINTFEARQELTPTCVLEHSLEHPRCGTAFLLTLVLLSVLVFALLGPMPVWMRLLSRIVFVPVLAAVAYEYIRWTARHINNPLVRWIIRPNLALQRLTTREPDAAQAEVAIAAFNAMLRLEQSTAEPAAAGVQA